MEPEKLVKSAKGIQRIVQEKLAERLREEEAKDKPEEYNTGNIGEKHKTPPIEEKK